MNSVSTMALKRFAFRLGDIWVQQVKTSVLQIALSVGATF